VRRDEYRVLVLGLDGATFDLMLPWIEQGDLPNLGRLMHGGSHSPLESTIPPITPCAWSSFMTGKNPGKHGLFDFVEPAPGRGGFRFANASSRHGQSLWGYMSAKGRRTGIVNVPMTYPPEPVNGYLISGMDAPHDRCRYTYPQNLQEELASQSIRYRIDIQHLGNMRSNAARDRKLRELCAMETTRTETLQYLARRYPCDFNMLVYTATDQVQHHFWHFMDPKHDKYDAAGADRYRNAIHDVYVHVDRLIGSVLQSFGEDTIVIIMSDHGFGPTSNVRVRLNQAMEQAGLLAFRREGPGRRRMRGAAGLADRLLRATLSDGVKRRLAGTFPRLRVWFENLDEASIDWTRTVAHVNEAYRSCPSVWITRESRLQGKNGGVVPPEDLLDVAERALKGLIDPQTGRPVISQVYRTRDLYRGPFAENAPDLIPSWWADGFLLEQSVPGGASDSIVERSTAPIQGGVEFAGSHRLEGVFVMAGGPVRGGHAFRGARIIDVAPTVLYLMGLPIPSDMDGRPLLEAVDPAFVGGHPPHYEDCASPAPTPPADAKAEFSSEEEEMIARRLRSMGYIE